jgi:protein-L-isoaspartate(D-aspartate) O-methyltransferase
MDPEEKTTYTVEQFRHFFAEEIRALTGASDPLVAAFSRVPREHFLGVPPWHVAPPASLFTTAYRATDDPRDVYHDLLIAIKPAKFLNNGQPTLLARLIDALALRTGGRVLHIGCGTGYFTAIMAEVVTETGSVVAVEIEPDLAAAAAANLSAYPWVKVHHRDAADLAAQPDGLGVLDAVLVNAAVTHPHPSWLPSLSQGGVMVLPLAVAHNPAAGDAFAIRIERHGDRFAAQPLCLLSLYSSPSLRDPRLLGQLAHSFAAHSILYLKSVRVDAHPQDDSCLAHSPGFCLSKLPVNVPTQPEPQPSSPLASS